MSDLERKISSDDEMDCLIGAVATNAIRELQIALGRGDERWLPDDWRQYRTILGALLNMKHGQGGAAGVTKPTPYPRPRSFRNGEVVTDADFPIAATPEVKISRASVTS